MDIERLLRTTLSEQAAEVKASPKLWEQAKPGDLRGMITRGLERFVATDPGNRLTNPEGTVIYDAPLVGFACAQDPIFQHLKDPSVVGAHHLLPHEWLENVQSVVSYFLPFTGEIRTSNRGPGLPSEKWVYARIDGESFNNAIRRHLVRLVEALGGRAVAPVLDEKFVTEGVTSNWSERHVAYAAGLGTFGLSRSLITGKGCAGRYGSVVTSLKLVPTPRRFRQYYDYCPWLVDGACGECIDRCPSGALTPQGKDVLLCQDYLNYTIKPMFNPRYGCGKCQTAVPCEEQVPI